MTIVKEVGVIKRKETARLHLRMTPEEKEMIEEFAKARHLNVKKAILEAFGVYYGEIVPMAYRVLLAGSDAKRELQELRLRHPDLYVGVQMADLGAQNGGLGAQEDDPPGTNLIPPRKGVR